MELRTELIQLLRDIKDNTEKLDFLKVEEDNNFYECLDDQMQEMNDQLKQIHDDWNYKQESESDNFLTEIRLEGSKLQQTIDLKKIENVKDSIKLFQIGFYSTVIVLLALVLAKAILFLSVNLNTDVPF